MSSQSDMVPELRPVLMSTDLIQAAKEGNTDVLVQRLGLQPKKQTEIQVTIEASDEHQIIEPENPIIKQEFYAVTSSRDTILHLLVAYGHNKLALRVFQRDMSMLKAVNNKLETPLHCAAKVGNETIIGDLIQLGHATRAIIKEVLEKTNENQDTALHVAIKCGHIDCYHRIMQFCPQMLDKVNRQGSTPLYMAIDNGYSGLAMIMLTVKSTLASTPFSDGMYPIHLCAHKGNINMARHFMREHPNSFNVQDANGRNLFHFAAKMNHKSFFSFLLFDSIHGEMREIMNAQDYEGNTPIHIAAMMGHMPVVRAIWENVSHNAETIRNNEGLTPFEVTLGKLAETEGFDGPKIKKYIRTEGHKFTKKWFDDVAGPPIADKWEKIQVIGLGSVLITTVTFAAAFTIPGGYNQDNGTPILGRRYMFRAFILANALAFIQGFLSLFALLGNAMEGPSRSALAFAIYSFVLAASSMVIAFGLGLYVTLAPVSLPLAITLLVVTLFLASPALFPVVAIGQKYVRVVYNIGEYMMSKFGICTMYAVSILIIFCLALL